MTFIRSAAAALGGEVAGRDAVLCPGPGHSPKDRSLSVKFVPTAPRGFLITSFAGNDWRDCRDHVRRRLGLPAWEPGDEQRRNVPPHHVAKWDLAATEAEANETPRAWTEDEIVRIERAQRIWNAGKDPRARSPNNICVNIDGSIYPTISPVECCASIRVAPGRMKTPAKSISSRR